MGTSPARLTASELMRALSISKRTLYRYKARGMPSETIAGRSAFDLEACEAWMRSENLTGRMGGPTNHGGEQATFTDKAERAALPRASAQPSSAGSASRGDEPKEEITNHSLLEARVAKERALAEKHQWAVEVARRQYLHRDELTAFVAELASSVRAALLALPGKVSARWAAITDPRELQAELEEAMGDVLKVWQTVADRGPDGDADEAAA